MQSVLDAEDGGIDGVSTFRLAISLLEFRGLPEQDGEIVVVMALPLVGDDSNGLGGDQSCGR